MVKIISYIKRLLRLGFIINNELVTNLVLQSLPKSWANFITNFNLNKKEKSFEELYMLRIVRTLHIY